MRRVDDGDAVGQAKEHPVSVSAVGDAVGAAEVLPIQMAAVGRGSWDGMITCLLGGAGGGGGRGLLPCSCPRSKCDLPRPTLICI